MVKPLNQKGSWHIEKLTLGHQGQSLVKRREKASRATDGRGQGQAQPHAKHASVPALQGVSHGLSQLPAPWRRLALASG